MSDTDDNASMGSDEEDMNDYYNNNSDDYPDSDDFDGLGEDEILYNNNNIKKRIQELERFDYQCFKEENVKNFLAEEINEASNILKISPPLARLVLQLVKWRRTVIAARVAVPSERNKLLVESGVLPDPSTRARGTPFMVDSATCGVCFDTCGTKQLHSLSCKHLFCAGCWSQHLTFTVRDGMPLGIRCMEKDCNMSCPEDFVRRFFRPELCPAAIEAKYNAYLFASSVTSHHQLRFCPGVDCRMIFHAENPKPRRVQCTSCNFVSCFECSNPYHTPADCVTIKKWLTKCADDSETANYISANTKDCPACHICIEKNGGCNHIQCSKCKADFCWVCLGDWKHHGNSYYECSRYKEGLKGQKERSKMTSAREALKKYLFYFHRWENHNQSLLLEAQARKRIQARIEDKVNKGEGTWIDWQYLLRAGELLAKCRSTLQYTYPVVYYADPGPEKTLFEYQQAQLEVEIEDLAWKLEHPGGYQRGEIENQMDVAEKRRQTLLARFVSE